MSADREARLAVARLAVNAALDRLAQGVFAPGVKLTLVARTPGDEGADVIYTDDDLREVERLVHGHVEAAVERGEL